jgi:radical SAM protein with 4Fe4S-binding SPASM domain
MINWFNSYLQYKLRKTNCKQMPIRIWIEPTNNCNFKCVMCPHKDISESKRGYMDLKLYNKIIDQCSKFRPSINLFLGGEPMLHPNIEYMIIYAHSKHLIVRLETNGSIFKSDMMADPPDVISFSVDGYDKHTYEQNQVGSNFETTISNIKHTLKLKLDRKPFVYMTTINLPNVKDNKDFKDSFKELLPKDKIDCYRTVEPHNFGGSISNSITGLNCDKKYRRCVLPWASISIRWNGDMMLCCMDFNTSYCIGNANNMTIAEAWNNDKAISLRRNLISKKLDELPLCKNCSYPYSKRQIVDFMAILRENILR